jgi:threonine synthase
LVFGRPLLYGELVFYRDNSPQYDLSQIEEWKKGNVLNSDPYYFHAFAELKRLGNTKPVVFCVPSGNFGNLSAGLIAKQMGLPVQMFVAATNVNNVVPNYLENGKYEPIPSRETISNAMDVGNPSNFIRMRLLAGDAHEEVVTQIIGDFSDDSETRKAMKEVYERTGYVMCPHTAVAYLGLKAYTKKLNIDDVAGVVLSTAHYAKFLDVVEDTLGTTVDVPLRLSDLLSKEKVAIPMSKDFAEFKKYLLS